MSSTVWVLVGLPLFALDPLELVHVGGPDGRAHHRKVVDLSDFSPLLVVLDEKLEVRHVLKLDKLEGDRSPVQLAGCQPGTEIRTISFKTGTY